MKLQKVMLITLLLLTGLELHSQNEKYVIAESGLIYRNKPNGKVLGKFDYGEKVKIIENSHILEKIKDNGKEINGEWLGVKYDDKKVYCFGGYLCGKKEFELINNKYYQTYFRQINKKYKKNIKKYLKISPVSKKEYDKTISKKRKNLKKIRFKYVLDDDNENPYRVYSYNNYENGFENEPSLSPNENYLIIAGLGWDSYGYLKIIHINSGYKFEEIMDVGFTYWTKDEDYKIKWINDKTFIIPINEKILVNENHHEIKKEVKYLKIKLRK